MPQPWLEHLDDRFEALAVQHISTKGLQVSARGGSRIRPYERSSNEAGLGSETILRMKHKTFEIVDSLELGAYTMDDAPRLKSFKIHRAGSPKVVAFENHRIPRADLLSS